MSVIPLLRAVQFLAALAATDPVLGTNPAIPGNLQISTFATGLAAPYGLYQLPDGSILAATTVFGPSDAVGFNIVRITQANGVANSTASVFSGSVGPATGLTGAGNIVAVAVGTNTGSQIVLMQAGSGGALTQIGALTFAYPPAFWDHDSHAITMRAVPGQPNRYELVFSVGSQENDAPSMSGVGIAGFANATLNPNSIYIVAFDVTGGVVSAASTTQLASGLRNAFALGFNGAGDLYFGENGIDFNNTNTPVSADYFGIIPNGTASVLNFGFPSTYYDPITGAMVGSGAGITQPFAKFLPINGMATQGVGGLALAPPMFPLGLNNGVFFGFYGRHEVGSANNLDGVVYVDAATGNYFDFIPNSQDGISHPMSLLATSDALYIADMSTVGMDGQESLGAIYRVSVITTPEPATVAMFAVGFLVLVVLRRRETRTTLLRRKLL
jgi:glucose/arabinose dehydrogenase